MDSKGLQAISYQGTRKVEAGYNPSHTTETLIGYIVCCVLPFCFYRLFVNHLVSVFDVRWLGGSFAILGNSVGLCEIANVPPNAMALVF